MPCLASDCVGSFAYCYSLHNRSVAFNFNESQGHEMFILIQGVSKLSGLQLVPLDCTNHHKNRLTESSYSFNQSAI